MTGAPPLRTARADAPAAVPDGRQPIALAVLMVVLFLTFLDNTVVSVALGSVQGDLHAGVTALQWVVSAYALTFAVAMLATHCPRTPPDSAKQLIAPGTPDPAVRDFRACPAGIGGGYAET